MFRSERTLFYKHFGIGLVAVVIGWTEYRAVTPTYYIQVIKYTGRAEIAEISVSVCPRASGVDCRADEISATRYTHDAPLGPAYCGALPCEDQTPNLALIRWAVEAVYKPEFMVAHYTPGLET